MPIDHSHGEPVDFSISLDPHKHIRMRDTILEALGQIQDEIDMLEVEQLKHDSESDIASTIEKRRKDLEFRKKRVKHLLEPPTHDQMVDFLKKCLVTFPMEAVNEAVSQLNTTDSDPTVDNSPNRTTVKLQFRLTEEEFSEISKNASESGQTISAYIWTRLQAVDLIGTHAGTAPIRSSICLPRSTRHSKTGRTRIVSIRGHWADVRNIRITARQHRLSLSELIRIAVF